MNAAILGVGSNIEPEENIPRARQRVDEEHTLVAASDFVTTRAISVDPQPDYRNGAWSIRTTMERDELDAWCKRLERELGRRRTDTKDDPRTIDLDIVVWNGEVVHDDYYARDFLRAAVDALRDA